uniref:site-specific DNA-methyltransferase (cytosine-N(4)-specific) n=1 Tax=Saccharopolyspora sp. TaxID=33915 RepID=O52711_9PSEU|nr:SapI M1 methyltransferase [Saccharopolyspora sp.]
MLETLELVNKIAEFQRKLPYTQDDYKSRSWGHPLHSLCSYQGKLKPSLAHWLVKTFSPEGGTVLDPMGGVGTIAFEAALTGRVGITNDKSPLAATVTAGKLAPSSILEAEEAIGRLAEDIESVDLSAADYEAANFGLNARVSDYYHPDTLKEILRARRIFSERREAYPAFVWASLLHVLHGNRPYALSRISHPITPFNPSGVAEYRSVVEKIAHRARLALRNPLPEAFTSGAAIEGDFRDLSEHINEPVDAIITSPPFMGMRFDRPNWLRLWFCGWDAEDFWTTSLGFLERHQVKSRDSYIDFFEMSIKTLKQDGLLVMHLGSGGKKNLVNDLKSLAVPLFELAGEVIEDVDDHQTHGIRDRGLTTKHHLLFFKPA